MEYKKRLKSVLFAALTTAVGVYILKQLHLFEIMPSGIATGVERTMGFALSYGASLLTYLIAAIPGMFFMKRAKVPYFIALNLFAIAVAFWLSYLLTPLVIVTLGWAVWLLPTFLLLIVAYVLADLLFNEWKASFKQKVVVSILLTIVIAVAGDRLLMAILT